MPIVVGKKSMKSVKSVFSAIKSVDFAAKAVYFVAAHAAQRQNQFDL
ncbi:hypothetical protein LCGC14_2635930, partial [marine sediment metagenome]